ncbi:MAG: hypothetical protein ACPG8W_14680 [Candidatus Promineifilaceae bacterium]
MGQFTPSHIRTALKHLHRDDNRALANSNLQHSNWHKLCQLEGEPDNEQSRCLQIKTLLHWMIEQLAPNEIVSTAKQTMYRSLLTQRFIEGRSITKLIEQQAIARATIHARVKRALNACVALLDEPLDNPLRQAACHTIRARIRYQTATSEEQRALRQLSIYREAIAAGNLRHVPLSVIASLRQRHLILGQAQIRIHPQLRAFVLAAVSAEEHQQWHDHAATMLQRQGNIWRAHAHLFNNKRYSKSTDLLLKYESQLLQFASLNQLLNTINVYQPKMLTPAKWSQLQLLAARYAHRAQGQQLALDHLQAANPNSPTFRAFTELHMAIVNRDSNRQQSLAHFDACIAQTAQITNAFRASILTEAHLRRAWLYLNDPIIFDNVEADLAAATKLIERNQFTSHLLILLHNTKGRYYGKTKQFNRAFACYEAGLKLANEINHIPLKLSLSHNIGSVQTQQKRSSLRYLLEGRALADSIDDQFMVAHFEKLMGAYYFHLEAYHLSAEHNKNAYRLFLKINNQRSLAFTCFDLAEALIMDGKFQEAKRYFDHAQKFAYEHAFVALSNSCKSLSQQYPELKVILNTRQWQMLKFARLHQAITYKTFQASHKASSTSFQRDAKTLIQHGILKKVGRGRTTQYQLG